MSDALAVIRAIILAKEKKLLAQQKYLNLLKTKEAEFTRALYSNSKYMDVEKLEALKVKLQIAASL